MEKKKSTLFVIGLSSLVVLFFLPFFAFSQIEEVASSTLPIKVELSIVLKDIDLIALEEKTLLLENPILDNVFQISDTSFENKESFMNYSVDVYSAPCGNGYIIRYDKVYENVTYKKAIAYGCEFDRSYDWR